MTYSLRYHPLIWREDFKRIDRSQQQRLIRTIEKKLGTRPDQYGRPLAGSLQGYWKLKVGEYRIVYRIERQEVVVYVLTIGFRRDQEVYLEALKRLGLL
ncbi:MAG: type II toxin-antitoxin system RelE/ParE family toxin [Nitrospirota bacterium]